MYSQASLLPSSPPPPPPPPPPPLFPPPPPASCSAVPLAAGSSQVRCSTRATTCSLLTAVYRRGTVQNAEAPSGSTARVRILAGEPAPPETEFTRQNLSSKTQTNEVLLIKHSFIAGFYRLAVGEDLWRDTCVKFIQIQVYLVCVLSLFWVNLNINLWLFNPLTVNKHNKH